MKNRLIAVLGGARSGKSSFAEQLAIKLAKPTVYIATAENKDPEMAERIAKHQASRPSSWETLEAPSQLSQAILAGAARAEVVLIDCLSLYISNLLLQEYDNLSIDEDPVISPELEERILEETAEVIKTAATVEATVIIVANEVGKGIVPLYQSARFYRDVAGRANQLLAQTAEKVFYVLAGIPLELKSLESSLAEICEELRSES